MKIGTQNDPSTAICASNSDTIVVRGADLCKELIGTISFTEHFFLLVVGRRPTLAQLRILDATLVAIAEHGLVPSVQASRMTYAAAPEAFQGAVAAGILGCGSVILGSAEAAGRLLLEIVTAAADTSIENAAKTIIESYRQVRRPIPGYGHPLHKAQDPRVQRLLAVAEEVGLAGKHVAALRAGEKVIPEVVGRALMINVSGAIPAILLDAGFPMNAVKGIPIVARAASLVAHIVEEQSRSIGFVLSEFGEKAIAYDGQSPDGFIPTR